MRNATGFGVLLLASSLSGCSNDDDARTPPTQTAPDGGGGATAAATTTTTTTTTTTAGSTGTGGSDNPAGSGGGPPNPPVEGDTTLTEITGPSGLDGIQSGIGWAFDVAIEDFDDDGLVDIFLGDHDSTNRLAHNDGNDTFSNKLGSALEDTITGVWSLLAVDIDADNRIDALINWDSSNSATFKNDGAGGFIQIGRPTPNAFDHQANGMAWADYDGDGDMDFVVNNLGSDANHFWRHTSNGTTEDDFQDVAGSVGMVMGRSGPPMFLADLDGDGYPDMFLQSMSGVVFDKDTTYAPKVSFNKAVTGPGAGFEPAVAAGLDGAPGCGAAFGDFDNDGDLDAIALGAAARGSPSAGNDSVNHAVRLFRNDGAGSFEDVTASAGLPVQETEVNVYVHLYDQAVFVDLDNDGHLDIVYSGPDRDVIYRNLGNGTFEDVTDVWKLQSGGGRPQRLFVGDIDNDGDMDLVTMSGQTTGYHLWRNNLNNTSWLDVRLRGSSIPSAVGSKIYVYAQGHVGNPAFLLAYREVLVGTSHRAPLAQHFGLDPSKSYDVRAKFWPTKKVVDVAGVMPTQRIRIHEDGTWEQY